jgi:hypothetical protein
MHACADANARLPADKLGFLRMQLSVNNYHPRKLLSNSTGTESHVHTVRHENTALKGGYVPSSACGETGR